MKFFSPVAIPAPSRKIRLDDGIMLIGSCFADSIGRKMAAAGFRASVNPFGTLYNPASILEAVRLLGGTSLFGLSDCVEMGAGAGRVCSFRHHTSFSRPSAQEFLENANANLQQQREFWKSCNVLIISLGTSFVWYRDGLPVSNCLKRPASEFTRRMLSVEESSGCLRETAALSAGRQVILTVSPIRHLGDGAHANALSKARLLLAADSLEGADYFPASEILLDELRDYRFYSDDLVHPSPAATGYIWERFLDSYTEPSERARIEANEKTAQSQLHRPLFAE